MKRTDIPKERKKEIDKILRETEKNTFRRDKNTFFKRV